MKKRKREANHREEIETNVKLEWEYGKQSYSDDLRDWQRGALALSISY
jgi:hypothetical protein